MKPKLRFPKYENQWLSVLIEDVAERGTGHTPKKGKLNYYNGGDKWVSLADSKKLDNGYIEETKIEISKEGLDNSSAVLHPEGSVILSRDAGVGKSAVMKSAMAVSQHFIVWKAKQHLLYNWFLYYTLQILKPEFERIAVGNTVKTIGFPYFKKLRITVPEFSEQQKIASFLFSVDSKIQQLIKKKELLEQYKKGVMQKIFKQEIRFKDEEGKHFPKWSTIKAKDLFESITNKNHDGDLPILASTQERGVVFRDTIGIQIQSSEASIKSYKIVEPGDFVISLRSFQGGIEFSEVKGICSPAYTILKPKAKIDNQFFKYYFKKEDFIKRLSETVIGIRDGKQISYEAFGSMKLLFPDVREQKLISGFLIAIDKKISIVKSQLEETTNFKQGLLQQMFV